jgi:hypothetical protein
MPVLVPGVPVRSRRPTLLVENELAAGSWVFRLTVIDDAGIESGPADLVVRVIAPPRPGVGPGPVLGPGPVVGPEAIVGPEPFVDTQSDGPARPARRPSRRRKPKP